MNLKRVRGRPRRQRPQPRQRFGFRTQPGGSRIGSASDSADQRPTAPVEGSEGPLSEFVAALSGLAPEHAALLWRAGITLHIARTFPQRTPGPLSQTSMADGVCQSSVVEGVGTPPQECSAICNLVFCGEAAAGSPRPKG